MRKLLLVIMLIAATLFTVVACKENKGDKTSETKEESNVQSESYIESEEAESVNPDLIKPTNVSVSAEGKISFTNSNLDDVDCYMYINGSFVRTVENGETVKASLKTAENKIKLEFHAKNDSRVSPKSEEIKVVKNPAVTEVKLSHDGKITFKNTSNNAVVLYVTGEKIGEIESGADISQYMLDGVNDFSLVVASEGMVDSDETSVTIILHEEISVNIDTNGIINFLSRYGYEYEIYVDGENRGIVEDGDSISRFNLTSGEHLIQVKIIGEESSNRYVKNQFSNQISVVKYDVVKDLTIKDDKIYFTSEENSLARLYVNGKYVGNVENGEDVSGLFTSAGFVDLNIELIPLIDGFISSDLSDTYDYKVPKYGNLIFKALSGKLNYEDVETNDEPDGIVSGVKITAEGPCSFEYTENVDLMSFKGSLIRFRTTNTASENPFGEMRLRLVDVENEANVIEFNFYRNGDTNAARVIYVNVKYKDYSTSGNMGFVEGMDYAGLGNNIPKYTDIKYDYTTQTFTFNWITIKFGEDGLGYSTEITGFEKGARLEIAYDYLQSESGIIVNKIDGCSFESGKFLSPEEYSELHSSKYFKVSSGKINLSDVTTNDAPDGEISGKKITAPSLATFSYKEIIDFNNFSGSLISFRTTNTAQSNPFGEMTIKIIDVEDENNVITFTFFRNGDSNAANVIYVNTQYKSYSTVGNAGLVAWMDYAGLGTTIPKFADIKYNSETQTFEFAEMTIKFGGTEQVKEWGYLDLGPGTEITGFAKGARLEISFNYLQSESGIIVNKINNLQYIDGDFKAV